MLPILLYIIYASTILKQFIIKREDILVYYDYTELVWEKIMVSIVTKNNRYVLIIEIFIEHLNSYSIPLFISFKYYLQYSHDCTMSFVFHMILIGCEQYNGNLIDLFI